MSALRNPRHERFCQELVAGKSQAEAYALAGFKGDRRAASHLRQRDDISRRIDELVAQREQTERRGLERAIERTAITKAWVMEKLRENAEAALAEGPKAGAVANRALELLGREIGMFIERSETGSPGEFDRMSRAELEAELVRELMGGGISEAEARKFVERRRKRDHDA